MTGAKMGTALAWSLPSFIIQIKQMDPNYVKYTIVAIDLASVCDLLQLHATLFHLFSI